MSANENQIIVYQPNETVRLDVHVEKETVWLTQSQMATLFGVKQGKKFGEKQGKKDVKRR